MIHQVADGPEIYYEVTGSGAPVVLIAGTGCDDTWWALQRDVFARKYTVITPHMRGAGRSTIYLDPESYSSAAMADDLASLLGELDLGPAHVVGHSLGSCIAQQFAIRHPAAVASVQLHATWAYADEWLRSAFIATTDYALAHEDPQAAFRTVKMWVFSPHYLATRTPARVADTVTAAFISNPHLEAGAGLRGHLHADRHHDTRADLAGIDVPVLVTAGELDASFPPRYGRWVHDQLPRARWHLFTGKRAAHAFNIELAEEFNHVSLGFLADQADLSRK